MHVLGNRGCALKHWTHWVTETWALASSSPVRFKSHLWVMWYICGWDYPDTTYIVVAEPLYYQWVLRIHCRKPLRLERWTLNSGWVGAWTGYRSNVDWGAIETASPTWAKLLSHRPVSRLMQRWWSTALVKHNGRPGLGFSFCSTRSTGSIWISHSELWS